MASPSAIELESIFKPITIDTYRFGASKKITLAIAIIGSVATVFASIGMAGVGASFVATIGASTPLYILISGISTTAIGLLLFAITMKKDDSIRFIIEPRKADYNMFLDAIDLDITYKDGDKSLIGIFSIEKEPPVIERIDSKDVQFEKLKIMPVNLSSLPVRYQHKTLEKSIQYLIETIQKEGKSVLISVDLRPKIIEHNVPFNLLDAAYVFLKFGFSFKEEDLDKALTNADNLKVLQDLKRSKSGYPEHENNSTFGEELVLYYYPEAPGGIGTKFFNAVSPGKLPEAYVRKDFSKKGMSWEQYIKKTGKVL